MDTVLVNIVSSKVPLKFSIAITMTPVRNFVNFRSSHVRLQRFRIYKKKNWCFSKVHTRMPAFKRKFSRG